MSMFARLFSARVIRVSNAKRAELLVGAATNWVLGIVLSAILSTACTGQTLYLVNSLLDAPEAQLAQPDGLLTLREAVIAASRNQRFGDAPRGSSTGQDVIKIIVAGTIYLQGGELICQGPLDIAGPGANQLVIDAAHKSRIFRCLRDSVLNVSQYQEIVGLKLINGAASDEGGGILTNTCLYLAEVEISLCSAQQGGGVASFVDGDLLYFYRSTVAENMALGKGGGIYLGGESRLMLLNSTVAKCVAGTGGGGIAIDSSGPNISMHSIVSSTIADNLCAAVINEAGMEFGGGLGVYSSDNYICYSSNTLFAQNLNLALGASADVEAAFDFRGYANFIGAVGGNFPLQSGQLGNQLGTSQNPLLPALEVLSLNGGKTRCMRPLAGSPLVNAGRNDVSAQLPIDQRGVARVRGGTIDIGAVER